MGTISQHPATETPQGRRTKLLHETLPSWIVIGRWLDGRRKPYFVRYGQARKMESFPTEKMRNDRAEEVRNEMRHLGRDAFQFDPKEWREYIAMRNRTQATLPQLEEAWNKMKLTMSAGATVSELIGIYKAKRKTVGRSKDALKHRDLALERFEKFAGSLYSSQLSEETVMKWLGVLETEYKLGDVARAGHFSAVRAMFNAPTVKKLCKDNPCDYMEPPHVEEKDEVAVLTLKQAFDFFKANREQREIGKLALEAFGGLRFSSASKVVQADLDLAERGITLPASKHKSGRRHYVDGYTGNLWRWIRFAPSDCWTLTERNYMRLKSESFIRAGFPNPGNGLRHTMPTMHLSAFKNAAALATLLQHRNATMLYQRYKGRGVSQAVGRAYFMITPRTVLLSFERFCRLVGIVEPKAA